MTQIHATAVSIDGSAVLLSGPSGSGKSDLALRLIDAGAVLIADDRCDVTATDGDGLTVSPPAVLEGMLEVRGVGILVLPFESRTPLRLVCEMSPPDTVERLPSAETTEIDGVRLPFYRFAPFEASAPAKVIRALRLVEGRIGSVA